MLALRLLARRRTKQGDTSSSGGFTLIEMLVVLALIGLLTALIGPQVVGYLGGAKEDAARAEIANLETSISLFKLDMGRYPSEREGLAALIDRPTGAARWRGPYLQHAQVPEDPWGHSYIYRSPGRREPFDLFSEGPDGGTPVSLVAPSADGDDRQTAARNE